MPKQQATVLFFSVTCVLYIDLPIFLLTRIACSMISSDSGRTSSLSIHWCLALQSKLFLIVLSSKDWPSHTRTTSTSDGISAANQTNLALKGIIGLRAVAKISNYTGQQNDSDHFQVRGDYLSFYRNPNITDRLFLLSMLKSGQASLYHLGSYLWHMARLVRVSYTIYTPTNFFRQTSLTIPWITPLLLASNLSLILYQVFELQTNYYANEAS